MAPEYRVTRLRIHVCVLIAFVLFGGNVVAAEPPTAPAATAPTASAGPAPKTDSTTDGKYYLIWQVTAPKIEMGADVRIEPLVLTNGTDFVFIYDFCRQRYLDTHNDRWAEKFYRFKVPVRLDPERFGEDTKTLFEYCEGRPITLDGASYHLRNNHGFSISIGQVHFSLLEDWVRKAHRAPVFPDNGKGVITKVYGTTAPQYPAAALAQQPYIFLMSSNSALLKRIVPSSRPTAHEQTALFAKLDRYRELRAKGEPVNPPVEACKSWENGTLTVRLMGRDDRLRVLKPLPVYTNRELPPIADNFFDDLDHDGKVDLVSMVQESQVDDFANDHNKDMAALLRVSQGVVRIFFGNGATLCPLRQFNPSSASRPALLLRLKSCGFLSMNRHGGPVLDLVPLYGKGEFCRPVHTTYRLWERTS